MRQLTSKRLQRVPVSIQFIRPCWTMKPLRRGSDAADKLAAAFAAFALFSRC